MLPIEDYTYMLGKDIFVNPIFDYSDEVTVVFPKGSAWVDYFDHTVTFAGGANTTFNFTNSYNDYPAYYRAGSILPLNITTDYMNVFGNSKTHSGYLTLAIHYPIIGEMQTRMISSHGIQVSYVRSLEDNTMMITISAPNGFRADQNDMKIMLDIRGLLPTLRKGFTVSQFSMETQRFVELTKYEDRSKFNLHRESTSSFHHEAQATYYTYWKGKNKAVDLKQQHLWVKVHDISKGARIVIK